MEAWIVILIVAAVIALAALVWMATTRRRTADLRERFGPEYDRTVASTEDRRAAEAELAQRRARREQLNIRPLDPAARQRYMERWTDVQTRFVDEPGGSLAMADELVLAVMRDRGYPMDDFDQRAADVSVDHPNVVENYRSAHGVSMRLGSLGSEEVSTEDLRRAIVHYRALFGELLEPGHEDRVPEMPRQAAR